MAVCHRCLLMISIDSRHPELMLDLYISLLSHLALIPGQLKQKVVQLTPFSPIVTVANTERLFLTLEDLDILTTLKCVELLHI